jgi:hypothetical protein
MASFDHLVGGAEQLVRNSQAEFPRGFEVDHELKCRGQFDRQLGRFSATKNSVDVSGRAPETSSNTRAIGHQAASLSNLLFREECRQARCCGECNDAGVLIKETRALQHNQSLGARRGDGMRSLTCPASQPPRREAQRLAIAPRFALVRSGRLGLGLTDSSEPPRALTREPSRPAVVAVGRLGPRPE